MSQVVMDADLRAKLKGLTQTLDIVDEAGSRVGRFVPEEEYGAIVNAWASARWSPAEEERLAAQTGGRSLADIWKDLGRS